MDLAPFQLRKLTVLLAPQHAAPSAADVSFWNLSAGWQAGNSIGIDCLILNYIIIYWKHYHFEKPLLRTFYSQYRASLTGPCHFIHTFLWAKAHPQVQAPGYNTKLKGVGVPGTDSSSWETARHSNPCTAAAAQPIPKPCCTSCTVCYALTEISTLQLNRGVQLSQPALPKEELHQY